MVWNSGLVENPNGVYRTRPKTPTGYDSREGYLKTMRERYDRSKEANQRNQDAGEEDARFVTGRRARNVV